MVRELPHRGLDAVRPREQDPYSVSAAGEWLHRRLQREFGQRLDATDGGEAPLERPQSRSRWLAPRTPRHSSRTVDQQPAAAQNRGQRAEVSPDTTDHPEAAGSRLRFYTGSLTRTAPREDCAGL